MLIHKYTYKIVSMTKICTHITCVMYSIVYHIIMYSIACYIFEVLKNQIQLNTEMHPCRHTLPIYTCTHIHMHTHVYMHVFAHIGTHVYIHVCMFLCLYVCVCKCV